jgi:hypothetical protein
VNTIAIDGVVAVAAADIRVNIADDNGVAVVTVVVTTVTVAVTAAAVIVHVQLQIECDDAHGHQREVQRPFSCGHTAGSSPCP